MPARLPLGEQAKLRAFSLPATTAAEGETKERRSWSRREEFFVAEGLADINKVGVIQRQYSNGNAANCRPADQNGGLPSEMTVPPVPSGIEQPGQLLRSWIDTGDVRAFVAVAMQARKGQVVEDRGATMLASDDVVDGERNRWIVALVHPAVFAGITSPLPYPSRQRFGHRHLKNPSAS